MNLQPTTLKNEMVQMYPLQMTDFEELFQVASDELLWEQHPNKNRYKREVFQVFFDGAITSKGAFLVRDSKTSECIGSSRFYDYDPDSNTVLIGYTFIGRKFWGKNFNNAIKSLMLNYAFQYVDAVCFHIGSTNFRSQKAILKIGAEKIDEDLVAYYGETPKLNYIYKITKNTWIK